MAHQATRPIRPLIITIVTLKSNNGFGNHHIFFVFPSIMSTPSLSDSEQKPQRGLKRKTVDSVVEHSSSPESPSKRLRRSPENLADRTDPTLNAASVNEVLFNPDGKFYYDDGDILLIVEHTFFCVHTDKLKATGGIFEDMLSGNIRPSEKEFLYGLPMLYVPLVSLRQLRFFLAHIYGTM